MPQNIDVETTAFQFFDFMNKNSVWIFSAVAQNLDWSSEFEFLTYIHFTFLASDLVIIRYDLHVCFFFYSALIITYVHGVYYAHLLKERHIRLLRWTNKEQCVGLSETHMFPMNFRNDRLLNQHLAFSVHFVLCKYLSFSFYSLQ